MLLSVHVHAHRLVALLDSGSTHNFINADLMRRLRLSTAPHPSMRVLVANGDRVPCEGVARDVALAIGGATSASTSGGSISSSALSTSAH